MLNFQPAILIGDELLPFPRPIGVCRIQDAWDFLKLKVPFKDGDEIAGASRDGAEILIEGELGSCSGELKLSEETMLQGLLDLRAALHDVTEQGYTLALYHNPDTDEYHHFQRCRTNRLEIDLSHSRLYSYSVSIHAADPLWRISQLP